MTNFQLITAEVSRNGNSYYPTHVRGNAARKMLNNAIDYVENRVSPNHGDGLDLIEAIQLMTSLRNRVTR